jgi:predicted ATP-dependent endonuclease of OLD family
MEVVQCLKEGIMELQSAHGTNFRSIVDSGEVDLSEGVSIFIGKNEQGKTNFLKCLASFNQSYKYSPHDLPNHLRPSLEAKNKNEIPVISLTLAPDKSERAKIKEISAGNPDIDRIRSVRYFDGLFKHFAIFADGSEAPLSFSKPDFKKFTDEAKECAILLGKELNAHAERHAPFKSAIPAAKKHIDAFVASNLIDHSSRENLVKTFSTALKGLPHQDSGIQKAITDSVTRIQKISKKLSEVAARNPEKELMALFPVFVLHTAGSDRIPNFVPLQAFIANPELTSRGMANLCAVAGLSTQKIEELASSKDSGQREAYEDEYKGSISGTINEFWSQKEYTVHFRIESDSLGITISDNNYSRRIRPTERSDGFQWYLSFHSALLAEGNNSNNTVILLDNPALDLHPDGQRDIKKFLEEKISPLCRVIYVTHSPAMIDTSRLEQVRAVELRSDEQGTIIHNSLSKTGDDFDLLDPIRSAIGASIATSLISNDWNVLVEGAADKPILEGAFKVIHPEVAGKILVNGSLSETKDGILPRFYKRSNLPFVIYLDADSAGRDIKNQLKAWEISEDLIVDTSIALEKEGDFELEDCLSEGFYYDAVSAEYPELNVERQNVATGKITKAYDRHFRSKFGIGFTKNRVAKKAKELMLDTKCDDESLANLKKITSALIEILEKIP